MNKQINLDIDIEARKHLEGKSSDYLNDVISHGIHNITNEFADNGSFWEYSQIFCSVAEELIEDKEGSKND